LENSPKNQSPKNPVRISMSPKNITIAVMIIAFLFLVFMLLPPLSHCEHIARGYNKQYQQYRENDSQIHKTAGAKKKRRDKRNA
jgi:hypothetical protein